jgi:DNA-binding FadR family transcriptional regulator
LTDLGQAVPNGNYRERLRDDAVDTGLPKPKLAEKVAADIERDIRRQGWPVGEIIGSEKDLLAKYQVSRGVLREAVRLLEHHLVATMRRGPGGGLVVTEPNAAAVTGAVAMCLEYQRVTPAVVFEARKALELVSVQMTTERIDEAKISKLRALLISEEQTEPSEFPAHSHDWHIAVAEMSENPALSLFVTALSQLTREAAAITRETRKPAPRPREEANEVHNAHQKITESIIAGDVGVARHRMLRHLEAIERYTAGG